MSDEVSCRLEDFEYELESYDECNVNGVEFRIEEVEEEENEI